MHQPHNTDGGKSPEILFIGAACAFPCRLSLEDSCIPATACTGIALALCQQSRRHGGIMRRPARGTARRRFAKTQCQTNVWTPSEFKKKRFEKDKEEILMTASHANTPFKSPISLVPRARVACRPPPSRPDRRAGWVSRAGGTERHPSTLPSWESRAGPRVRDAALFPLSLAPSPGAPGCGRPVSLLQPCESITYFIQFPTLRSMALGVKVAVEGKRTYPARPTRQQL